MTAIDLAPATAPEKPLAATATVVVGWAIVAAGLVALWYPKLALTGPSDPDSLMRLVEVRDFLAGQAWTDLHQPRLGAPDGVEMHWSRLIDWPIATLIRLFDPFLGRAGAELAAMAVWPVLTLLPYLWGLATLCRRLMGPDAVLPAVAFGVFAAPALGLFMPGLIDHHNVQLALSALLAASAADIDRNPGAGTAAGVTAAVMMAIGTETLPVIAVVALGLSVAWYFRPAPFAPGLRVFGLAFAAGMSLQRMTAAPPSHWLVTACDIASLPYVAAAVVGGIGLALLTMLPEPSRPGLRAAGLGALAAAVFATVLAIAPTCLRGPYAELDPRIVPVWLDFVAEARNVFQLVGDYPGAVLLAFPVPILALAVSVVALRRAPDDRRPAWALLVALLAVMLAVTAWQLRGAKFAALFAVPGLVWLVLNVRVWAEARPALIGAAALLAVYVVPNQFVHMLASGAVALAGQDPAGTSGEGAAADPTGPGVGNGGQRICSDRARFATLAGLPAGIVLAPSNLGPAILANTPHAVVAAPYHRDPQGILDGFAALQGDPATAAAILRRREVAYLAVCTADEETGIVTARGPDGLLARLLAGTGPSWLEPAGGDGPLRIWRVRVPLAELPTPALPGLAEMRLAR